MLCKNATPWPVGMQWQVGQPDRSTLKNTQIPTVLEDETLRGSGCDEVTPQHHEAKLFLCCELTDLWPSHALFSSRPCLTRRALGALEVQNRMVQVSMGGHGQHHGRGKERSGYPQLHREQGRADFQLGFSLVFFQDIVITENKHSDGWGQFASCNRWASTIMLWPCYTAPAAHGDKTSNQGML